MNTAVLYDACERAEAGSGELLAGRLLYSYSLNNGKKNMKSASQYGFSPEQKH